MIWRPEKQGISGYTTGTLRPESRGHEGAEFGCHGAPMFERTRTATATLTGVPDCRCPGAMFEIRVDPQLPFRWPLLEKGAVTVGQQ